MTTARDRWQAAFDHGERRDADFDTMSGVPVDAGVRARTTASSPGQWPYTRGPYASMYRSKLWTMRMFAGFGTALDTNRRFRELLAAGGDGLSTAFDLPTLMGRDSDDPLSLGEVGKCGVAIDTLADVEDLYRGIDLSKVTTSMTINSPAPILLAMYVAAAERGGASRRAASAGRSRTTSSRSTRRRRSSSSRPARRCGSSPTRSGSAPPRCRAGTRSRCPGTTSARPGAPPRRSWRSRSPTGSRTSRPGIAAGLAVDEFAPRLSFFFNAHIDFFEEIAKYRAARRIWARWMRDRYGARAERSLQLRFHTQTAGVSLTAQQPEVNIVRTAIEALAGVLGGTQSLHTNSMDEVLALPTEKAARIALRTQQVIAYETRVAERGRPARRLVVRRGAHRRDGAPGRGGVRPPRPAGRRVASSRACSAAIEEGWFQGEIADSAYELERKLNDGRHSSWG